MGLFEDVLGFCVLLCVHFSEYGIVRQRSCSNLCFQTRIRSMAGHDLKLTHLAPSSSPITPSPSRPLLHSPLHLVFAPLLPCLSSLSTPCCPFFKPTTQSFLRLCLPSFPHCVPFAPWGGTSTATSIQEQASTVETHLNKTAPICFSHQEWERGSHWLHCIHTRISTNTQTYTQFCTQVISLFCCHTKSYKQPCIDFREYPFIFLPAIIYDTSTSLPTCKAAAAISVTVCAAF